MPTPVDALSDKALAASKLAALTHLDAHHKAASEAHQAAFAAAHNASRPSLAQSHLHQAADHDKSADPTCPEGKCAAAMRATMKARDSGKAEDHDKAEQAHKDAAQALQDDQQFNKANKHHDMAGHHAMQAGRIRNPPPRPAWA
jgi:hypothetical protein